MQKILIIDDEKYSRETINALLHNSGWDLTFAESAVEGLPLLDKIKPDLILSDVMMPIMDGFEFCRIVKSDKAMMHIPIILITALNSKEDLAHGIESGADDFISKPINKLELRSRIQSLLRLKLATDRLRSLAELREDLSGMIAHDMRTPLQIIMMAAGSIKMSVEDGLVAEAVESTEDVLKQARKLNSYLNDLLLTAKMENEKVVLDRHPANINQIIKDVVNGCGYFLASKKMEINTIFDDTNMMIEIDSNLFMRVFDNLITNSIKYSGRGTTIEIHTIKQNGKLIIKLMDQGSGIPDENKNDIFSKYEIVKLRKKGTLQIGLGLAFVKLVIDAHDGSIRVEDNQPKGSVFIIELPC